MSDKLDQYYEKWKGLLIQQGVLHRRDFDIGISIVNTDTNDGKVLTYIKVDQLPIELKNFRDLIENDMKSGVSLYFLLVCGDSNSKLYVHELV